MYVEEKEFLVRVQPPQLFVERGQHQAVSGFLGDLVGAFTVEGCTVFGPELQRFSNQGNVVPSVLQDVGGGFFE
jgi:hypothetical protein